MAARYLLVSVIAAGALGLGSGASPQAGDPAGPERIRTVGPPEKLVLPKPWATPSGEKRSQVIGWPQGRAPNAPRGFRVTAFAEKLESPRRLYVLPNGDVLVAESSRGSLWGQAAGRLTLLRDADQDGKPEMRKVFLAGLNRPYGMLLVGNRFYVGNTDGIVRYPYQPGQTQITASGEKILDLPAGGHYTRNLLANADGSKIYVAVGSGSNVDEDGEDAKDPRRAAILEMNPDGSGMRIFAGGLRNPVGLALQPGTNAVWTVVNERDRLGDDLVPDYLTRVREGAFYGWPYSYYGQNEDPRKKGQRPDLVAKAIPPDYALGTHVAPLGLVFYRATSFGVAPFGSAQGRQDRSFPQHYRNGAFVALHGSWNRSRFAGYKVVFVPFQNNKPSDDPQDFLTGFIAADAQSTVYGRPVGLAVASDGALLLADDGGHVVWRVGYGGGAVSSR